VNQVLIYGSSSTASRNEDRTAQNLEATILATGTANCYTGTCYYTGQAANTSVTATVAGNVVTLTAKTTGTSSNFAVTTNYATGIGVVPGTNGTNATTGADYIFMSVFSGTQSGCLGSGLPSVQNVAPFYGCIMSFNVTPPFTVSSGMTATGTLNVSSTEYNAPTGGLIIDNSATTPSGASEIYFLTNEVTGTTPCTGICAVQATQLAP
jgi:hypothetical protein